jgi:hypothetical protein
VHRAPAARHQLGVYLDNGGQLRMDPRRSADVVGSIAPAGGAPLTVRPAPALWGRMRAAPVLRRDVGHWLR